MKKALLLLALSIMGCGYSSVDNELICQPKKIYHQTPMLCGNRNDVDVSMGVMRDGVGSMSSQDIYLTVPDDAQLKVLEAAITDGKLVKIHYNEYRVTFCQQNETITSVEVVEGVPKSEAEKKQQQIDALNKQLHQLQGN